MEICHHLHSRATWSPIPPVPPFTQTGSAGWRVSPRCACCSSGVAKSIVGQTRWHHACTMPFLTRFMGFEAKAHHSGPQMRETRAVKTGRSASVQMSESGSVYRAGWTANEEEARKRSPMVQNRSISISCVGPGELRQQCSCDETRPRAPIRSRIHRCRFPIWKGRVVDAITRWSPVRAVDRGGNRRGLLRGLYSIPEVVCERGGRVGCGLWRGGRRSYVRLMPLASGVPYLAYRTAPPGWMVPERDVWRERCEPRCVSMCEPTCGWHQGEREEEGTGRQRPGQDGWTGSPWERYAGDAGASGAHWS